MRYNREKVNTRVVSRNFIPEEAVSKLTEFWNRL
jgi:hypothetical protein